MKKRVVYFDDDATNRRDVPAKLEVDGRLTVRPFGPPKNMDISFLADEKPDLFLVDYDLTRPDDSGSFANYRGGALASVLREQYGDYPIVLLSRPDVMSWWGEHQKKVVRLIFNGSLLKADIIENASVASDRLVTLAEGFEALRKAPRTWDELKDLLDVQTTVEEDMLRGASPPIGEHIKGRGLGGEWEVPAIADWLENVIFEYPGILYDAVHAATLLGIDEESFLKPELQHFFKEAKYSGCLAPRDGRWWKTRLIDQAKAFLLEQGIAAPIIDQFAPAFETSQNIALARSHCVWSKESPADWVCYVLKKPVMIRYSLAYHPDSRPAVMDEARVSFTAIVETNDVKEELLDSAALDLVDKIRREGRPL